MRPFDFPAAVQSELARARAAFPALHSGHEAWAVIHEETEEFWELVRQQAPDRTQMLRELIQVAAMAQRAAEDLGLTEPEPARDEPPLPSLFGEDEA